LSCSYRDLCSGCQYLERPYEAQIRLKTERLQELLAQAGLSFGRQIEFVSSGEAFLRDRLDFTLEQGHLGLYGKDQQPLVDIEVCAQLSPALQSWLTEFRAFSWPVKKGSVRLRVGPQGQKGAWLDFSNIDIKALLDEKTQLRRLQEKAFVEIGQRRKVPIWTGTEFKLRDPQLNLWFETWMGDQPVSLYCQVASFTQPSLKANRLIAQTIEKWVGLLPQARVIEFGSGIGNLTLPALFAAQEITACEIDELSLEGLKRTLQSLPASLQEKKNKITIHRGDFQKKLLLDFSNYDLILANPPRSGLKNFLEPLSRLKPDQRPEYFIYMSCFPESMMDDLKILATQGYAIEELKIVDQFPQTKHFEVLGLLKKVEGG